MSTNTILVPFYTWLRRTRKTRGLSQLQLANTVIPPVTQSTVVRWESGGNVPMLSTPGRVCLAMGVACDIHVNSRGEVLVYFDQPKDEKKRVAPSLSEKRAAATTAKPAAVAPPMPTDAEAAPPQPPAAC